METFSRIDQEALDERSRVWYPRAPFRYRKALMAVADRPAEEQKELSRELANHVGRWVAVRDNEVVASETSPEKLLERTEGQEIDRIFLVTEAGTALL